MTLVMVRSLVFACRRLHRRPLSVAGILLTLTLGIAISAGMFSVLRSIVLRALPYPDGDRIVTIHAENLERELSRAQLTPAEAIEAVQNTPTFENTAYYGWGAFTSTGNGAPRLIETALVSAEYFAVFGTQAALGRTLNAADVEQSLPVAVLSHAAWMDLTGDDPDAIGQPLRFGNTQFELVGVMPESFAHPDAGPWMYRPMFAMGAGPGYLESRMFEAVGRLAAGTQLDAAREALQARVAAMRESHGVPDFGGWTLEPVPLLDDVLGDTRNVLFTLFAMAVLVLLVACSTTASLVSIRFEARKAELAVRRTIGASDERVAAEFALELALLTGLAATGGVWLASLLVDLAGPFAAAVLPRGDSIAIDARTLAFAAVGATTAILTSGLAPLANALRSDPAKSLRDDPARTLPGAPQSILMPAVGVGLAAFALVTALALATSLARLGRVEPGFRTEDVAALQVFRAQPDVADFVERAFAELQVIPGVRGVAAVRSPPLDRGARFSVQLEPQHRLTEPIQVTAQRASAGYHRFLDIPILRGRGITDRDTADAPRVTVINTALARLAFGDADPLGQTVAVRDSEGERRSFEVVGVAADTRNVGLRAPSQPELTLSIDQYADFPFSVTLLADAPDVPLQTLREAVWRVDPEQAINRSFTLAGDLAAQTRDVRFFASATGVFAALALLLGVIGINAVVVALQQRRTREIGLRLALGAAPWQVATLVLATAGRILVLGLVIAALLAWPAFVWLERQIYGVAGLVPWALFALAGLVVAVAGVMAAAWPAWRAAHVAPMESLRSE